MSPLTSDWHVADDRAASSTNANPRYGVTGAANGPNGIGVKGTGPKYGVYSNGPFAATGTATFSGDATFNGNASVAAGKSLNCTGCVSGTALSTSAKTYCSGYPHVNIDWTIPGSTPGNGCNLYGATLTGANLAAANLTNANLNNANLNNANLSGATLTSADVTGVTWSNTTCPNGQNSNDHANTCAGQGGGL